MFFILFKIFSLCKGKFARFIHAEIWPDFASVETSEVEVHALFHSLHLLTSILKFGLCCQLKFEIHASVPESYVSKSDCIDVWGMETYITNIHDILRCLH